MKYSNKELEALNYKNREFSKAQSVADRFKTINDTAGALTATHPGGELGNTVAERSDVYFRPNRELFGYGPLSGLNQK